MRRISKKKPLTGAAKTRALHARLKAAIAEANMAEQRFRELTVEILNERRRYRAHMRRVQARAAEEVASVREEMRVLWENHDILPKAG
jgi:hypothetical protein